MERQYDIINISSPNFNSREDCPIIGVIAHCMGTSLPESIRILTDPKGVSAHYLVPQLSGTALKEAFPEIFGKYALNFPERVPVIQLVSDNDRAWHAGASAFSNWNQLPSCEKGLNSCTIGIEFHTEGYGANGDFYRFTPFSEAQKQTGIALIDTLMHDHGIPKTNLLAHSTIAVGRKTDPGSLFFWKELYEHGLGYLPQPRLSEVGVEPAKEVIPLVQAKLLEIGFVSCPQTGVLDAETNRCIDAYRLQYDADNWHYPGEGITLGLLNSLNAHQYYPGLEQWLV